MSMTGQYKQFDSTLFNENDARCRAAVLQYVSRMGGYAVENPDKYGPDLILYSGLRPVSYIEVERKVVWKKGQAQFPWNDVNLPERKGKFLKLGLPIEFWILREDFRRAIILTEHCVSAAPLVEVSNKYTQKGELFYKVLTGMCSLVDLPQVPSESSDK